MGARNGSIIVKGFKRMRIRAEEAVKGCRMLHLMVSEVLGENENLS